MDINQLPIINKETLTSRQRVLRAINHQPIDRVPIDLGMHYSTGISAFAYWNLREYLGLSTDNIEIIDMMQFLPRVQEDILKRFHCDCILLQPSWSKTHSWNPRSNYKFHIPTTAQPYLDTKNNWLIESTNGQIRMPENGFFFDGNWPSFEDRTQDEVIKQTSIEAERLFKETDYFTSYIGFWGFFNEGDIDWQCRMITDPEEILEENANSLKRQLDRAAKVINSMGKYIQGICIGGDLGSQTAPLCRPSLYEELCAPFLKKLCSFIHENSDIKIFYHCCGSIRPMIPILIDCGIDVLNPVQISAVNMNPTELKKEFGEKITFWGGGCDTQNILNNGSPEDVAENVKNLMHIFKNNSGYVFNPVHNIMGDISPQKIIAMYDTAYKESFYNLNQ